MALTARFLLAMCLGNILEWYDFGIFMAIIPWVMPQFLPPHTPYYLAMVFGYSILAVSYLARPIGGLLLGYWGDKHGKAPIFLLTLVFMSVPSLLIALWPTFASIGAFAPLGLLFFRLIQGMSLGGECMNTVILSYELSTPSQRNLLTIFTWMISGFGLLLGNGVVLLLQHLAGHMHFIAFFWRIPFFIGGLLGAFTFYVRRYIYALRSKWLMAINPINLSLIQVLKQNIFQLIYLFVLFMPLASMYYLIFFYMPTFTKFFIPSQGTHMATYQFWLLLSLQILPIFLVYFIRPTNWQRVIYQSLGLFIIILFPAYYLILHGNGVDFLLGQFILVFPISLYAVAAMLHALEFISPAVRFTLLGFIFNLTYALFGNLIPLVICYWAFKLDQPLVLVFYLFILTFIALLGLRFFHSLQYKNILVLPEG